MQKLDRVGGAEVKDGKEARNVGVNGCVYIKSSV